ncbi:DUF2079 domain-containing protein [Candidatus Gottesmanbacteria bacterium]|nr:DUF2079 domain-containing protein [Candidatus Gottesmanbacteria bacterium]
MIRIQEIFKKVKSKITLDLAFLTLGLIVISLIYAFISISLHNRFLTFGLDLGYFDETIWKISRGKFPYSGVGCIWLLEDHFQPILYLLAPLYWIWDDVRILLLFQSFVMVFAAFPLYLLSKKITRHTFFSLSIVFSYLFFIGTQFAILNEFHQVTLAPFLISLIFYALSIKKNSLFILGVIGLLVTKEDLSLLVAAIGIGLIFKKGARKTGVITLALGIVSFFLLIYWIMPSISIKGVYSHMDFGEAGATPVDILLKIIVNPSFFFRTMVIPQIKLETLFRSLFNFGFLPIFSPFPYFIPLAEDFVSRFIYSGPQVTKWGLVNHHAATSAILLAITSIYGARRIEKIFLQNSKGFLVISLILIITTITQDILFKAPVNSIFKKAFYFEEEWVKNNKEVLAYVPETAAVAAQNNLLPHLTHRDSIYRVPYGLNSEYIVVDLHDGPNKYSPLTYSEIMEFVQDLLKTKRYSIVYQKGEAVLLKRNYKTDITKSKYYGDTRYCYYSFEER